MRLKGRVAIVTGASRGIGAATARKLVSEGAAVALNDVVIEGAQQLVVDLWRTGGKAIAVRADVTDKAQIQNMAQEVVSEFGRIDILVNNAGVFLNRPLVDMSELEWEQVIDVNLKGSFLCSQAIAPFMMQQRYGKIVNVSSGAAYGAVTPGSLNYASAKAGILGLTFTLAMELGPFNINVNAVAPGDIDTEMNRLAAERQGIDFEAYKKEQAKVIPIRRFGQPQDVANVICFLVSEEASHVHGEVIHIFGGPSRRG